MVNAGDEAIARWEGDSTWRNAAAQIPSLWLRQSSPARSHQRHVSAVVLSQSERPREEPPAGRRRGPEVAARHRGKIVVAGGGWDQGREEFATVGLYLGSIRAIKLSIPVAMHATCARSHRWLYSLPLSLSPSLSIFDKWEKRADKKYWRKIRPQAGVVESCVFRGTLWFGNFSLLETTEKNIWHHYCVLTKRNI